MATASPNWEAANFIIVPQNGYPLDVEVAGVVDPELTGEGADRLKRGVEDIVGRIPVGRDVPAHLPRVVLAGVEIAVGLVDGDPADGAFAGDRAPIGAGRVEGGEGGRVGEADVQVAVPRSARGVDGDRRWG